MDVLNRCLETHVAGSVIDWWRRHHRGKAKISTVRRFGSVADVPDVLPRRVLAVVGEPAAWIVFECPCGTGHRIMVRARSHDRVAHWSLVNADALTLRPSVDSVLPDRRCHFWLREGRVEWV